MKAKNIAIKYLLSDLDGVIRHYPPERDREIEKKLGLPEKTITSAAFEKTLLSKAICGIISDEEWRAEITKVLSKFHAPDIAALAVKEWSDFSGVVDHQYLRHIETHVGVPVVILTNGTSRLKSDLLKLEIGNRFFKVFNSAEIGICKPDKKLFIHVIQNLNCQPHEVLFVDDSMSHVQAAQEIGMRIHHYSSLDNFRKFKFTEDCE